jgi:aspartyl-tRNA(Asn)/glutamyl-tRNA(Gln) amidotransferase subunit C
MSVTRDEITRVARLAALDVEAADMDELTRQVSRILDYVSQLASAGPHGARLLASETGHERLRPDVVKPDALAFPPKNLAPSFKDGLFLVPGHAAQEDE